MELIINEITSLKPIDFNYEEIKKDLAEKLEKYNNLVYTEESIKVAKEDRAKLNKLSKAFNDRKIEVKKQFMQPYDAFENKMKELIELVQRPILAIDGQVKSYEAKQKEEKREQINQIFNECINGFGEELNLIFPLLKVFDEKWLNASVSLASITKELSENITKIVNDISVIESFKSEFEVQLKDKYLSTLDLGTVMIEKSRLEQLKMQLEEKKKVEEEKAKEVEQIQPKFQEVPRQNEAQRQEEEDVIVVDFRVQVTKMQLEALRQFLNQNNIKYGRVK